MAPRRRSGQASKSPAIERARQIGKVRVVGGVKRVTGLTPTQFRKLRRPVPRGFIFGQGPRGKFAYSILDGRREDGGIVARGRPRKTRK